MRNTCFNEYKKPRGNRSRKHTDAKQFVRIWNHFACFHLPNSVLRRLAKYSHCDNVFDWQQRDNLWMISISSKYQSEAGQASQSHGIGTKKRDAAKDFLSKPEVRSLEARLPPSTRRNRTRNPSDRAIPEVTSDPKGELQAVAALAGDEGVQLIAPGSKKYKALESPKTIFSGKSC